MAGPNAFGKHEGSCHCGAVRFAIESDFTELTNCGIPVRKTFGAGMA